MSKSPRNARPEAALPKGFRDIEAAEIRRLDRMLATIRKVYESYGFEPLDTSLIEYTDALGKFLPDQDRPNEGVFSFQDEDEKWLSLRYDLTAPLARYVAEGLKEQRLTLPFRRYAAGPVWRNEKPGPGRFRQFMQFDADTVGTDNVAADAEICMLAADTLEALGIKRGDYVIKVSNRKLLDGVMESVGLGGEENASRRLTVLRALDKFDRLRSEGVMALLGQGRRDESGDFTKGAQLTETQSVQLLRYVVIGTQMLPVSPDESESPQEDDALMPASGDFPPLAYYSPLTLRNLRGLCDNGTFQAGLDELEKISEISRAAGYGTRRIRIDPSVVRGLEYYTGPVFEAELTFQVTGDDGKPVRFGSVGGGGRYDGLVERFLGQKVPATGFSIGVSRLQSALALLEKDKPAQADGPVVVLVMDKAELPHYQRLTQSLRQAGIRAEMYLGTSGMKAQMRYADRRGAPCVVIQGGDERARGEVQIKDLIEGAKAAQMIKDNKEWKESRPAQVSAPEADLVAKVREILARHAG